MTAVQEVPTVRIPCLPAPSHASLWASVGTDGHVHVRPLSRWLRAHPASVTRRITDSTLLAVLDAHSFGGKLRREPHAGAGIGVYLVRTYAPRQPMNLVASTILGYVVRGPLAVVGGWDDETQTYRPLSPGQLDALHTQANRARAKVSADLVLGPPARRLVPRR